MHVCIAYTYNEIFFVLIQYPTSLIVLSLRFFTFECHYKESYLWKKILEQISVFQSNVLFRYSKKLLFKKNRW